jgi:hypothetical protein
LYPDTPPTPPVEADQARLIKLDEAALAVKPVGTDGGVAASVVALFDALCADVLPAVS